MGNVGSNVSNAVRNRISISNDSGKDVYIKLTGKGNNDYFFVDRGNNEDWSRRLGTIDVYINTKPSDNGAQLFRIDNAATPWMQMYKYTGTKLKYSGVL